MMKTNKQTNKQRDGDEYNNVMMEYNENKP